MGGLDFVGQVDEKVQGRERMRDWVWEGYIIEIHGSQVRLHNLPTFTLLLTRSLLPSPNRPICLCICNNKWAQGWVSFSAHLACFPQHLNSVTSNFINGEIWSIITITGLASIHGSLWYC